MNRKEVRVFEDFFTDSGCNKNNLILGPCSIESYKQIRESAKRVKYLGHNYLRGGAYKPRTNPESFQGLGLEAIKYLREACDEYSLISVTEIMSEKQLDISYDYLDIIQIGARNMQNFELLKTLSSIEKPILFKRGLAAEIQEYVGALEYLTIKGKQNIILCERGVKSFDNVTRNMLDIMAVPILKTLTGLPVIVDVSHSTGRRDLLLPACKAAKGIEADGIMMEVHPTPDIALSDSTQQINFDELKDLEKKLWKMN